MTGSIAPRRIAFASTVDGNRNPNLIPFSFYNAFVNVGFRSFYVGLGRTRIITYTTVVLALVNIVPDYLLIFGKFGFPEMGIAGAVLLSVGFILFSAVSGTGKTDISLAIELTVLVIYPAYTYLIVEHWNGTVVMAWTAEWVYGSLLSLFSFIYLKSNRWKKVHI